jgi:hypothetical protein
MEKPKRSAGAREGNALFRSVIVANQEHSVAPGAVFIFCFQVTWMTDHKQTTSVVPVPLSDRARLDKLERDFKLLQVKYEGAVKDQKLLDSLAERLRGPAESEVITLFLLQWHYLTFTGPYYLA